MLSNTSLSPASTSVILTIDDAVALLVKPTIGILLSMSTAWDSPGTVPTTTKLPVPVVNDFTVAV